MKSLTSMMVAMVVAAAPLAAQQRATAVLSGRAPAAVIQAAQTLVDSAQAAGIPADPIVQKVLEGAAKNVPADRVIAALHTLFVRLVAAREALQAGGLEAPDGASIEAASFAMSAGLESSDVTTIARAAHGSPAAAPTMRVAGTLAALGVPAAGTVRLVSVALAAGTPPGEMANFPGLVESAVGRGMTPAQAAEGLARAAQARGGNPPGRSHAGNHPHGP